MNKMTLIKASLLIFFASIFLSCDLFTDSKSKDSESDNQFEVNLFGKVVSGNGNSIPGVVARLKGFGLTDTTERDGEYNLVLKEDNGGQSSTGLLKSKALPDTDTLEFSLNGQVLDIREVTVFIDTLPDFILVQRDISGKFSSNTDIDKIEAVLFIEGENDSVIIPLGYNFNINSYSGFMYMKPNTGDQKFSLFVKVYDNDSSEIGRSSILEFDNKLGDIEFETFDPLNSYPTANAGSDTLLSINDSQLIIGTGSDVYGGSIVKYEWDFGNTENFVEVSDGDTVIVLPSSPDDNYQAILKVTDDDGNPSLDTIVINVIKDEPIVTIEGNTTVAINTPIEFIAQTSQQFGGIVKLRWDNGIETGIDDSTGSKFTVTYLEEKTFTVSVEVEDDDGNIVRETKAIVVTNDSPVINGLRDTTISINDVITFTIDASDTNGIKEYHWNFSDSSPNQFDTTTQNEISHQFPSEPKICTVTVTAVDSFGNPSISRAVISVLLDLPIPLASDDTTVSIGDTVNVNVIASDEFGSIVKWEWDNGGSGSFVETSGPDTSFKVSDTANSFYPIIVRVTDDDGTSSLDTVNIEILLDLPTVDIGNDTNVFAGDTVFLNADNSMDKYGSIISYEWDIGNTGNFIIGKSDTNFVVLADFLKYLCILRITDDDGNISMDTMNVFVNLMKLIPSGFFVDDVETDCESPLIQGSDQSCDTAYVTIDIFMGATEVTESSWYSIMDNSINSSLKPKTSVTWYEAIMYCNELSKRQGLDTVYTYSTLHSYGSSDLVSNWEVKGYRLPTEDEWEMAARGGRSFAYPTDNGEMDNTKANYKYDGKNAQILDVGSYPPNPYGLFDMAGNVGEWCWNPTDRIEPTRINGRVNYKGMQNSQYRPIRGGNWNGPVSWTLNGVRVRTNGLGDGEYRSNTNGFRWVLPSN